MIKWEYTAKMLFLDSNKHLYEQLNELGQEGWEVIHIDRHTAEKAFVQIKRPIPIEKIDNYSEIYKWVFLCPTRVVISAEGDAVAPHIAAQQADPKKIDIVFVRDDGWTLGAPQEYEKIAESMWVGEWMAVIYGGIFMTYKDYLKRKREDSQ